MTKTKTITVPGALSEELAQALAEGEHDLGCDATAAGYALYGLWPTNDCPWGRVASVPERFMADASEADRTAARLMSTYCAGVEWTDDVPF